MGAQYKRGAHGYTIIEVMMFFAVTAALMLGVLGSASLGVNAQRYNDAVNTFVAVVQQEFTNATNVVNTKSTQTICTTLTGAERGTSDCVILGRLMTIDSSGKIVKSNLVGTVPSAAVAGTATEIAVIKSYGPVIDTQSQDTETMSWETKIEKTNAPGGSNVSLLIVRSPRSGNIYSYVQHAESVIDSDARLDAMLTGLVGPNPPANNARDQFMCVDRSGWVVTPTRAVRLSPYTSGPSGVSAIDAESTTCD